MSKVGNQLLSVWQVITFILYILVVNPAGEAFDLAIHFGHCRNFASDSREIDPFASHNPADEHGKGCQMAGKISPWFGGIEFLYGFVYGNESSSVIAQE